MRIFKERVGQFNAEFAAGNPERLAAFFWAHWRDLLALRWDGLAGPVARIEEL